MPHAAPKPCPRHPKVLLQPNQACPQCPKSTWGDDKLRGNRHQRGYGTLWVKLRDGVMVRDHYLCQVCMSEDRLTPATEVDHIIPKARGGTDNPDNLQAICAECHKTKTARESY